VTSEPTWLAAWAVADGAARARSGFAAASGPAPAAEPAGVWSAPGRVNLIGEHTDYSGGLSLPIALPHRTYVALAPRADDTIRLTSASQGDAVWETKLSQVAPGTVTGWGAYVAGVAWALAEAGLWPRGRGFDAHIESCVPLGAGLSSSAALECAVAVALNDLSDAAPAGRDQLAAACIRAENEIAGAATGGMDQAASLGGKAGCAVLVDAAAGTTETVPFDPGAEGLDLLVIDTRAHHALVDGQYAARREATERAASILGVATLREVTDLEAALAVIGHDPLLARRVRHHVTENARTARFVELLRAGQLAQAGPLLTASHTSLRDDYEVSSPELDVAVQAALDAGALGARMTGGGFGGSAIALIRAGEREAVAHAITAAFEASGFEQAPAFLPAPPSAGAGRNA
jgi:galactokinase